MVENEFLVSTIASWPTMDDALEKATQKMHRYLTDVKKINKEDAAILMSTAGDLKICQVVDPWYTARFEIKKGLLKNY
jgi:amidase